MKFPGGNGIFYSRMCLVGESGRSRFRPKSESERRLAEKDKPRLRKIQWRSFSFLVTVW